MSPMNAWLALRGLRTLPVRLKSQQETLQQVINFLQEDPRIERIYHPLCNGEQQNELAHKYLKGYGSLLGVCLLYTSIYPNSPDMTPRFGCFARIVRAITTI